MDIYGPKSHPPSLSLSKLQSFTTQMASSPPNSPNPPANSPTAMAPPDPKPDAQSGTDAEDWTAAQKEALQAHLSARRTARTTDARLSLPTPQRLLVGTSTAFLVGLTLGGSHGFSLAGLRFRAENAHRLPKEPTGWYLYHKSKNYRMMLEGVREGVRMGGGWRCGRCCFWGRRRCGMW
ncbi:hypothetical protein GMDG_07322 [Pseudogymnoascus destructans 20631-21]|uniref:Uncharacterized protein n=1 Tax=Pseudogymnoascus destructans (strain ATCC MYA-4855 / 20631-21) TaxID=658429 RepID=L8FXP3_PSED2|nr:hypothetical protein GMDG_07322 [Pseudogymnoascus destructans 20631-21]